MLKVGQLNQIMRLKSTGNIEKDMRRMVTETRKMYATWVHLNKATSVSLTDLFNKGDFGLLCAKYMMMKLRQDAIDHR